MTKPCCWLLPCCLCILPPPAAAVADHTIARHPSHPTSTAPSFLPHTTHPTHTRASSPAPGTGTTAMTSPAGCPGPCLALGTWGLLAEELLS